ncbi:TetR/AcrR family transcriptional regulator [Roseobacter sp. A03A-229]
MTKAASSISPKGEDRRDAIVRAARQMLLDEGYAGVSVRKIASELGISVGNLQYYFPTKDDLVEAVITRETQKPIDLVNDLPWSPDTVSTSIRTAVKALIGYYASDAGRLYAITEALALHDPRYAKLKADGYAYVFGQVEQLVAVVSPDLAADRRGGLARVLVALIDGASLQVQFAGKGGEADGLNALVTDVTTAIEHILKRWE